MAIEMNRIDQYHVGLSKNTKIMPRISETRAVISVLCFIDNKIQFDI